MNKYPIKTKYAEEIHFTTIGEEGRGSLHVAEEGTHIPFAIRRTYTLRGVPAGVTRGEHAHRATDQVIVPLAGSFTLVLDDGSEKQELVLDDPSVGIRLMPRLWHSMKDFSPDAVVTVFASAPYDEADYLRDYAKFLEFIKEN